MARCQELDRLYKKLIEEKDKQGLTLHYFEIVDEIKDHLRGGHPGGRPCPDPENRMA